VVGRRDLIIGRFHASGPAHAIARCWPTPHNNPFSRLGRKGSSEAEGNIAAFRLHLRHVTSSTKICGCERVIQPPEGLTRKPRWTP
jgi:hypothetical protein